MPPRKKCTVEGGCNQLLSKSSYYSHQIKQACVRKRPNEEENGDVTLCTAASCKDLSAADRTKLHSLQKILLLGLMLTQKMTAISDRAIITFLKFFTIFLSLMSDLLGYTLLKTLVTMIPKTMHTVKKLLKLDDHDFEQFAVCPACHTLYDYDSVVSKVVVKCKFVRWPRHTQRSKRTPCNKRLLQGTTSIPKRIYCYRSISSYLKKFAKQPDFLERCNKWRERTADAYISDIFDGSEWQKEKDGYLQTPTHLYGMLNVDWFQAYKYTPYSTGAIYMVILNLPREERFKEENVMLLGILPGPTEPKLNLNTYLKPMVNELIKLDTGMENVDGNTYKFRLLACSSDLPATRKLGGFLSFHANYGCSKCFKTFPRMQLEGGKVKGNFSGFARSQWPVRTGTEHKRLALRTKLATNAQQLKDLESRGCRWSRLFELPYFDPITHHTVDPMHCLFLGIAKTMTKFYLKSGLISKFQIEELQDIVNKIRVPTTVGRIPMKIASGFTSFTADQWKNWTLVYSSVALRNCLPTADYQIWMLFVVSVSILTKRVAKRSELETADQLLLQFCCGVERKYGQAFITPNFHMACHIVEVMKSFGPVYSFWCYSFERYNGILGDYSINNHAITAQIMRKFVKNHDLRYIPWPDLNDTPITPLQELFDNEYQRGTLSLASCVDIVGHAKLAFADDLLPLDFSLPDSSTHMIEYPDRRVCQCLEAESYGKLTEMYSTLYQNITVCRWVDALDSFVYKGEMFCIDRQKTTSCNIIKARWLSSEFPLTISPSERLARVGRIKKIFVSRVVLSGQRKNHLILQIDWFSKHEKMYDFGSKVQLYHKRFCDYGSYSYVPIQRVLCKCATYVCKYEHLNVTVAIPLSGKWALC